jgi:hypothetical protein
MSRRVDPIKAEVVARFLLATAEEMGATLMRTAFSPNIKERADCSTAVFDAAGQVIALAQRVPIHLGSMVGAVDEILRRYPRAEIRPGDMFIANDPYNGGGTHLPDITVISPVFQGHRIVAYVANIAHHADVGGMVPGSEAAVCKSIYQEGLRIPPVYIQRAGRLNRDVFDLILLNSRTPEERVGDLNAQFAANTVGARSVTALYERYGTRETAANIAAYLDFTERRFRAAINRLPRGRYQAEDFLDGDREGGRQGQARFRFHRLRFAACQRAQHSVPGAARNGLHRCEEPARPGGAGQRRLLPDDEHRRAPGLRRRSRPAGCHRLPLDLRERAGRCHRPGDVAGDTGQGARGQRPPSSLRAGRHRSAQRQLLRQL